MALQWTMRKSRIPVLHPLTKAAVDSWYRDCGDFATWREAQEFFESEGGPEEDPHHLDHNNDGVVCESLDGAPSGRCARAGFRFCIL